METIYEGEFIKIKTDGNDNFNVIVKDEEGNEIQKTPYSYWELLDLKNGLESLKEK